MKQNYTLLLLLCFLILNPVFSQEENCNHEEMDKKEIILYKSFLKNKKKANKSTNSTLTSLPVVVHIIRDGNGEVTYDLNTLLLNIPEAFAINNKFLVPIGIRFHLVEIRYIDSDIAYNSTSRTVYAPYRDLNSTNFFILDKGGNFSSSPASNTTPNAIYFNDTIIISNSSFDVTSTLPHEVGHYFGLGHTHNGTENGNSSVFAEHVARTGEQSNCADQGDLLCDTPADPYNSGDSTDIYGVPYEVDKTNLMSYYRDTRNNFTDGQNGIMINALDYRLADTRYDLDGYTQTIIPEAPEITFIENTHLYNTITWTNVTNNMGYIIERSSESASSGFEPLLAGGVGKDITSFNDRTTEPNTIHWYRVIAVNSENAYSIPVASVLGNPNIYCTPTNYCSDSWVFTPESISFDQGDESLILLKSITCDSEVTAFDYNSIEIKPEINYSLFIDQGYIGTRYYNLFIDLNIDGDFEDENEWIIKNKVTQLSGGLYADYRSDFQVATEDIAKEGVTAMRVISSVYRTSSGSKPLSSACSVGLGFTQDFSISIKPLDYTWTGVEDNDWTNSNNWDSTISSPIPTSNVLIPTGLNNYPTLTSPLTINSITLEPGATLVTNGNNVTGNTTYNKTLDTNWNSISSPVSGVTYDDIKNYDLVVSPNTGNLGFAPYNNSGTNSWDYISNSSTGSLIPGQGYTIKLTANDDLSFSGTMNSQDITHTIFNGDRTSFYLVGNPFTAYINSDTFFTLNEAYLEESTIWLWNGTAYETINTLNPTKIAPTQGFFVKGSGDIIFSTNSQTHQNNGTAVKQEVISNFELFVTNGSLKKSTKIVYKKNKTVGFDNGFDSSLFEYSNTNFTIFTGLINGTQKQKLGVQVLPNKNFETTIIPVGVIADKGEEIIFSTTTSEMIEGMKIILEDRFNNTYTNISEGTYKIVLQEKLDGFGQFYIHTTSKERINTDININNIDIYATTDHEITITGLLGETSLAIYSILGREVFRANFNSNRTSQLKPKKLKSGVYIVKLDTRAGSLTKKIRLN